MQLSSRCSMHKEFEQLAFQFRPRLLSAHSSKDIESRPTGNHSCGGAETPAAPPPSTAKPCLPAHGRQIGTRHPQPRPLLARIRSRLSPTGGSIHDECQNLGQRRTRSCGIRMWLYEHHRGRAGATRRRLRSARARDLRRPGTGSDHLCHAGPGRRRRRSPRHDATGRCPGFPRRVRLPL